MNALAAITLRPSQEAVGCEWYRSRLAGAGLADPGVSLPAFRLPILAVPVGGRRLGGSCSAAEPFVTAHVHRTLERLPGFPDVRTGPHRDTRHTGEWGATPSGGDVARGHFHGDSDSDKAISALRTVVARHPLCGTGGTR
ncbi:DUF6302 family protein [Streptomyces sp. NBC_00536]|uniref:DUF6302 family protein n=1 Tax=Streptomyces sp. NBC_00536 TaxID=2975769 RepID=UPI002E817659|nr:DUF6302 family protein [Streptomyces sp. NBC_00536]WUC83465.1 DUF6302 family protein [Streptomyces sp. NBC_00536]